MKILIVDNGTSYLPQLQLLFKDNAIEVIGYSELKSMHTESYDLIVLSGGHSFPVVGNDDKLQDEIQLIKNTSTPILGICYGFELIAHVFGSTLVEMPSKEHGVLNLITDNEAELLKDLPNLQVYESHRWIVKNISNELEVLAHSNDGIEAIKHKSRPIYGLQFHPEMLVDSTCGKKIVDNLLSMLKRST